MQFTCNLFYKVMGIKKVAKITNLGQLGYDIESGSNNFCLFKLIGLLLSTKCKLVHRLP